MGQPNICMRAIGGVQSAANFMASPTNAAVEGLFGKHAATVKKVGMCTAILFVAIAAVALTVVAAVYLAPLVPAAIVVITPYVAAGWAACTPFLATAASATGAAIASAAGATSAWVLAHTALALKVSVAVAFSGALIGYLASRDTTALKGALSSAKEVCDDGYNRVRNWFSSPAPAAAPTDSAPVSSAPSAPVGADDSAAGTV